MRIKNAGESKVKTRSLGEFGNILAMRPMGRKVQEELDAQLRQLPPGGVLVLDFTGVEMMDYSFADEALGTLYSRMSAKEYPDRFLILAVRDDELGEALMENIEVALNRREVAALVLPHEAVPEVITTLEEQTGSEADADKRASLEWRVVGGLPGHLVDTLKAVMDRYQVTVRELADTLKIDSATACNNRVAKLYQLHLVRREAAIVPEGGRLYSYSAIV
jgi:hypothetical protein